jgi:8-oxo-dGTP diphosphatase
LKIVTKKTNLTNSIQKVFGNKVRVRVSGLLYRDEKLLLIKHQMDDYELWAPPGGGVEFGETIEATLIREFIEETGIDIEVREFLFFSEYIAEPLHAIELFYRVTADDLNINLGYDPEIKNKILLEFQFAGAAELALIRHDNRHSCLKSCINPIELLEIRGQLK